VRNFRAEYAANLADRCVRELERDIQSVVDITQEVCRSSMTRDAPSIVFSTFAGGSIETLSSWKLGMWAHRA